MGQSVAFLSGDVISRHFSSKRFFWNSNTQNTQKIITMTVCPGKRGKVQSITCLPYLKFSFWVSRIPPWRKCIPKSNTQNILQKPLWGLLALWSFTNTFHLNFFQKRRNSHITPSHRWSTTCKIPLIRKSTELWTQRKFADLGINFEGKKIEVAE